jgi:hypothetical protein
MYQIEVQNDQGEWESKLICSEGLVSIHVDLYKSMYKGDVKVVDLTPEWSKSTAPVKAKRNVDLSPFFEASRVRGLCTICEETDLSGEEVAEWVKERGGDIYSSQHKGIDRLFCRLPEPRTEDVIPNIFDIY